jgi:hypothetical protein
MDPRIKELRLMRWKEIIVACNTSGKTKKEWMEENHISSKSFYRMQKKIREYELEKMQLPQPSEMNTDKPSTQFVDVTALIKTPSAGSSSSVTVSIDKAWEQMTPEMMLQIGQYNLYIGSRITESTLKIVLGVIRDA